MTERDYGSFVVRPKSPRHYCREGEHSASTWQHVPRAHGSQTLPGNAVSTGKCAGRRWARAFVLARGAAMRNPLYWTHNSSASRVASGLPSNAR